MPTALKAPILSNVPSEDDLAVSVQISKRILRRYAEAVERNYTRHEADADVLGGVVPRVVQFALKVAEMERDKVAERELGHVLHTFLPRTALAESHIPPTSPQTFDQPSQVVIAAVNPDDYS